MSLISQHQLEQCRKIDMKGWGEGQFPVHAYFKGMHDIQMRVAKQYALIENESVRKIVRPVCTGLLGSATEGDAAVVLFELVARKCDRPAQEIYSDLLRRRGQHLNIAVRDLGGQLMMDVLEKK